VHALAEDRDSNFFRNVETNRVH